MAASLRGGGTSPLNRDLFIMMVAVGIMEGQQAFSREVGGDVIAEIIFESSVCVTSVKQFRVGAFGGASTGCWGDVGLRRLWRC